MLIRILAFLLETVFFVLIAAALLRAWMNWLRMSMTVQPGTFVMAITNWLVKPLRQAMPSALRQSRIDWASLVAALLLALAFAGSWLVLFGVFAGAAPLGFAGPAMVFGALVIAVKMLLKVALQAMFVLVLAFAILSWVQPGSYAYHLLGRLTEPWRRPLRRVIPGIGGVDLSALVLLVLLQVGLMLLG